MALSEDQRTRFYDYCDCHQTVFKDRVVQEFFQQDQHIELLVNALDGNAEEKRALEDRFRKHFFRIRFIKYLLSTIKYCTLDQMRKQQKLDINMPLIFDLPLKGEGGSSTLGERLTNSTQLAQAEPICPDPARFVDFLSNEQLAQAFSQLSQKQQQVTMLCYALSYKDNEIAKMIGVSPQAVGKTRNLALRNLRQAMTGRR